MLLDMIYCCITRPDKSFVKMRIILFNDSHLQSVSSDCCHYFQLLSRVIFQWSDSRFAHDGRNLWFCFSGFCNNVSYSTEEEESSVKLTKNVKLNKDTFIACFTTSPRNLLLHSIQHSTLQTVFFNFHQCGSPIVVVLFAIFLSKYLVL